MKRMVKNGDLIDVEPDATITVAGKPIGGGGGGDYTAGSNIEISEAKEIAVKRALTNLDSIKLKGFSGDATISGYDEGSFKIKSYATYITLRRIYLEARDQASIKRLVLSFKNNPPANQTISFDISDISESAYAFLTKGSKVPFVPSDNGTYVLKATVSDGAVTYTWVAQ